MEFLVYALGFFLGLAIVFAALVLLGIILQSGISKVRNDSLRRFLYVVTAILFLPAYAALNAVGDADRIKAEYGIFATFSFDLRVNSKVVIMLTVLYAVLYYLLFTNLFA